jgi:methyl-accepting chemotaxis protein-2 (aspartate sensor receptor)
MSTAIISTTSSLARRVSLSGSAAIALVMLCVCAVMAWSTARQARGHVLDFAQAKAQATAQSIDAFDGASRQLTERFYAIFAESFGKELALDEAKGELSSWGEVLNDNFAAVDRFNANTGGVATVFARKGDDFIRITTSLKKENGDRAMGTMLGNKHPAFESMMAGKPWVGRAVLFGKHYMTRYQPMRDAAGKVVAILFIGFDLSSFQSTLDKMVADTRLYDTGGLVVIDPKKSWADAVFVAHPTAKGKKVTEVFPGADKALEQLKTANHEVVSMDVPLLAAGSDRWTVMHKSEVSGWWVVAEVADGEAMRSHYTALLPFVALFAAAAGVLGIGLAFMTRRWVTEPLKALGHSLAAVAQGDLTRAVSHHRNDEIGQLAQQAEAMRQTLSSTLSQVRHAAESIQTASAEVASGNGDLSHRTEQAASSLQQTASAIETLTHNVRQSADSASQANQLAASASAVAQRGGEVVNQVVSTMGEINHSSKRIADIIGTIDGIAFQTNILALNAAVEAARAGEQGRGFAVVASEVRSLAQRSAEAAREIKGLIATSVQNVESGAQLVQEAGSTMGEIVASVRRVTDVIGEITAASAEQSSGIGQVNGSVNSLDQMTQQNAALVEQSTAAAESLSEQAKRLTDMVGSFTLAH